MDLLSAITENGPWASMSQLSKTLGKDAATLRAELKELIKENKVVKTGKRKGTRYALTGTPEPEKEPEDFRNAILDLLNEKCSKLSRQDFCKHLNTYDGKIKPPLLKLLDEGIVKSNNKKKGQLFWLSEHEEEGIVEPYIPEEPKKDEPKNKEPKEIPVIDDITVLVKNAIADMKQIVWRPARIRNVNEYSIDELIDYISKSAHHNFTPLEIYQCFNAMRKSGLFSRLRHDRKYIDGWRIFYWKEDI